MEIFRQAEPGDWQGVFREMEAALRAKLETFSVSRNPRLGSGPDNVHSESDSTYPERL